MGHWKWVKGRAKRIAYGFTPYGSYRGARKRYKQARKTGWDPMRPAKQAYKFARRRGLAPGKPSWITPRWPRFNFQPARPVRYSQTPPGRAQRWVGRKVSSAGRWWYNTPPRAPWRYTRGRGHMSRARYQRRYPKSRFRMRE